MCRAFGKFTDELFESVLFGLCDKVFRVNLEIVTRKSLNHFTTDDNIDILNQCVSNRLDVACTRRHELWEFEFQTECLQQVALILRNFESHLFTKVGCIFWIQIYKLCREI